MEQALDVMEKNSLKRDAIDWPKFRDAVRQNASGALTRRGTYPALRTALRNLGDHHSFLRPAPAWAPVRWLVERGEASLHPRGEIIEQVGYI